MLHCKAFNLYQRANYCRFRMRWERKFGHPFDWAEWHGAYESIWEEIQWYLP